MTDYTKIFLKATLRVLPGLLVALGFIWGCSYGISVTPEWTVLPFFITGIVGTGFGILLMIIASDIE